MRPGAAESLRWDERQEPGADPSLGPPSILAPSWLLPPVETGRCGGLGFGPSHSSRTLGERGAPRLSVLGRDGGDTQGAWGGPCPSLGGDALPQEGLLPGAPRTDRL